jgi:hypothetical protein
VAAVKVVLLKAGRPYQTLAAQAPLGAGGAGSFAWLIPASLPLGSDYSIRIRSVAYSECRGQSARNFTISR